jgi:hypothetical protein
MHVSIANSCNDQWVFIYVFTNVLDTDMHWSILGV